MRVRSDMSRSRPRPAGRGRVVLLVVVAALFLLFTASNEIAVFFTDKLWFDSLQQSEVWSGIVGAKVQLAALFSVLLTTILWFTLYLADRRSPMLMGFGTVEDLFGRYQDVLDRRAGILRFAVASGFGLIGGLNMSGQWQEWLLFRNGGDFGRVDATFGEDIGFYVFRLPFVNALAGWAFGWGCIALLLTASAYYLNGGIRPQAPVDRVSLPAKRHLSIILTLIVLIKAAMYYLQRYDLVFSTRSEVAGATYTEVNAQLPAINLLIAVSLITAGLIVASLFRRGFTLPVVSIGGWLAISIVAGMIYPVFVFTTKVRPNFTETERPYVQHTIDATRDGLGLTSDKIEVVPFEYRNDKAVAGQEVGENMATIRNVSVLDAELLQQTFQNQQGAQNFYEFPKLDVDRYPIRTPDGSLASSSVVLGTRNISANAPEGWENETVAYTHGYGAALSAASGVAEGGVPDYLVKGVPIAVDDRIDLGRPTGAETEGGGNGSNGSGSNGGTGSGSGGGGDGTAIEAATEAFQPAIYFGELKEEASYVVVGATRDEISYVSGTETVSTRYEGKGGVPLDSFLTRIAFSVRFRDTQLLLSNYITPDSRLLFRRDVSDRLNAVAPFIHWDSNPYPVISGGRTVYLVDGYTLTDRFPNAERVTFEGGNAKSEQFNYVRNSVKATVDAYDGSVRLYVWDPSDPILAAWTKTFPSLFHKVDEMPSEIVSHVRYPEDLFKVQTNAWGRYRLTDPDAFYQYSGAWSVAKKPSAQPQEANTTTTTAAAPVPQQGQQVSGINTEDAMAPNYAMVRLPSEAKESYNIIRSFVPYQKGQGSTGGVQNLSGFMAARSDYDNYGKIIVYEMPTAGQVNGPRLVDNQIVSNQEVTSLVTFLNQQGSKVNWGQMIMVPVGKHSIVWVRPMYVTQNVNRNPGQAVPVLENVVVVYGGEVVMKPTLREAITTLFGDDLRGEVSTFETGGGLGDVANGGPGAPTTSTTTTSAPTTGGTGTGGSSPTTSTTLEPLEGYDVPTLLRQASELLSEADVAYEAKDLNGYIAKVDQARRKIEMANQLLTGSGSSTTTSSTTTPPAPA